MTVADSRGLRFGAWLPQGFIHELRDVPAAEQWPAIVQVGRDVERLGYDSLWVSDHLLSQPWVNHHRPAGAPRADESVFECWSLLAGIAQHTERVRLGQLTVANTFRPPALLAKIAASVDRMSGGRVELGIGAAWFEREHRAFGIPFPDGPERVSMLDESLELITRLWTEPTVDHHGRHYRVEGGTCSPRPLSPIPILVGGKGPRTLEVVARRADRWNYYGSVGEVDVAIARLDAAAEAVGRDPASIERTWFETGVLVRETDRAAAAEAERLAGVLGLPSYRSWLFGGPETVAERLAEFVARGFVEFMPQFADGIEGASLELFASEVVPRLRAS